MIEALRSVDRKDCGEGSQAALSMTIKPSKDVCGCDRVRIVKVIESVHTMVEKDGA